VCLSPIIRSPLNGPVKMSPSEPGDTSLQPERVATSRASCASVGRRTVVTVRDSC
jgi:hypothetical protein